MSQKSKAGSSDRSSVVTRRSAKKRAAVSSESESDPEVSFPTGRFTLVESGLETESDSEGFRRPLPVRTRQRSETESVALDTPPPPVVSVPGTSSVAEEVDDQVLEVEDNTVDPPAPPIPPAAVNVVMAVAACYKPWEGRVVRMAYANWIQVPALLQVLRSLRRLNFSIATERRSALTQLDAVYDNAPFEEKTRFPEKGEYICDLYGPFGPLLSKLTNALGYKDPSERNGGGNHGPNGNRPQDFGDSLMAFSTAVASLSADVTNGMYGFNRAKFESFFCVEWK